MKTRDIEIPKYSFAEELWNAISHGLGAVFGIVAGVFLLLKAIPSGDPWIICSISFYIFSIVVLYTMSCLYHSLSKNVKGKKVLRVLDHDSVYFLICGTYTPFCLISLRNVEGYLPGIGTTGWVVFSVMLLACIIGTVFNSINIKKYKILSMICNLVAGWSIIVAFPTVIKAVGLSGALLLLFGGIAYSAGAIIYGIGKKKKWMHTVFHFFVLAGTVLQFFAIYFFVLQ
ncbi:MAG: hemolysin III family protein [Bacilli bacterium]|jgi:hemolysin III